MSEVQGPKSPVTALDLFDWLGAAFAAEPANFNWKRHQLAPWSVRERPVKAAPALSDRVHTRGQPRLSTGYHTDTISRRAAGHKRERCRGGSPPAPVLSGGRRSRGARLCTRLSHQARWEPRPPDDVRSPGSYALVTMNRKVRTPTGQRSQERHGGTFPTPTRNRISIFAFLCLLCPFAAMKTKTDRAVLHRPVCQVHAKATVTAG